MPRLRAVQCCVWCSYVTSASTFHSIITSKWWVFPWSRSDSVSKYFSPFWRLVPRWLNQTGSVSKVFSVSKIPAKWTICIRPFFLIRAIITFYLANYAKLRSCTIVCGWDWMEPFPCLNSLEKQKESWLSLYNSRRHRKLYLRRESRRRFSR